MPDEWTIERRELFTRIYRHMTENPAMFQHAQAAPVPLEHWQVTCWNVAWIAIEMSAGCPAIIHSQDGEVVAFEALPGDVQ